MLITESGALPSGVTFVDNNNGTATLAGTPGAGTTGIYPITITADNGVAPNARQNFTLTVNQPPVITNGPPPSSGTVGIAYNFSYTSTGFPAPSFSVNAGALPDGLSLSGAGVISGIPTTPGTFSGIVVRASNTAGFFDTNPFTITITAPASTQLISAASRKSHGPSGDFDLPLALSPAGNGTVEPRANGPTTIVFAFNGNIAAADGMISSNEFTIVNATYSSAAISGNQLTLNLSSVVDQSVVSVTLNGIDDTNGNPTTGDNDVEIRALVGDADQDHTVAKTDLQAVKAHARQPLDQMS
jgi:hypothetical protein